MPRPIAHVSRLAGLASLLCLLAACQVGGPGSGATANGDGVTPNAVTGGEIEVTALDDLPAEAEVAPVSDASGTATAAAQGAAPGAEATEAGLADAAPPETEAGEPAPKAELSETPATPKSEMQLACEKKKGSWTRVGKGDFRACVFRTKDANKRCTRESDCEGVCLARSGTCSPLKPLYGCNEILQDNGARVTLCIE